MGVRLGCFEKNTARGVETRRGNLKKSTENELQMFRGQGRAKVKMGWK
jgi:hypothetical protein